MLIAALLTGVPLTAPGAHGAWSGKVGGPQLSAGQQSYAGPPLRPAAPLPPNAAIRRIDWRITLLAPAPPGLTIKLCGVSACLRLHRLAGQQAAPLPFAPGETLRFVYAVNAFGPLSPPVQVVSSQVTVNYRW
ncbi:flagellar protein FlhE [Mixta gaviniae]|uniref:Flagellar protein FlhE n=1 Tax=Mixta gaviniae TaxID=665914 RepID=A0A2L0IAX3_9GAMM|nr:flagellar protein FlhE [Mixta gaviniae]AUX91725.1 flagellar protein FlhE [Mixta gaviniae]